MTERGLPIVDGAPACPFVAFDDDRDERAAGPDHRHRCYAEPNPAPRALAHQEAYCLSSAFPVCPTFQDWARREAARSRQDGPRPTESDAAAIAAGSQRNPPRNWSAPPPWASRVGASAAGSGGLGDDDRDPEEVPPTRGRGLSGSFADRVAGDPPGRRTPTFRDDDDADLEGPVPGPPPAAARPAAPPDYPVTPPAATVRREPAPSWRGPETDEDEPDRELPGEPGGRTRYRERDPGGAAAFAGNDVRTTGGSEGRPARRRDPAAPEWEAAPPAEAYPTLRARRLPELSLPPLLVAVLALALAAAVLFALPGLLGFGNPSADATPTPRGSALPTSLLSLPPTPVPLPTQQTYIVQSGDTMSRIADRFGVPLGDLIAANAETIPNPDNLQIGQAVIIPVPVPSELPGASVTPATP